MQSKFIEGFLYLFGIRQDYVKINFDKSSYPVNMSQEEKIVSKVSCSSRFVLCDNNARLDCMICMYCNRRLSAYRDMWGLSMMFEDSRILEEMGKK